MTKSCLTAILPTRMTIWPAISQVNSEASDSDCLRQSDFGSESQSDAGMRGNADSSDEGRIGVLGGEMVDDTLGLFASAE